MATLTVQARNVDPVFAAADSGGDVFANDGQTELLILNETGGPISVLANARRKCSHGFLDHWPVIVEAGELFQFGPFLPSRFNDSAGQVSISYAAAGLAVAAKRLR